MFDKKCCSLSNISRRDVLEENNDLEPRVSVLEGDLDDEDDDDDEEEEEEEPKHSESSRRRRSR